MPTCIAFIGDVNTGDHNKLWTVDLIAVLGQLGIHGAHTYQQSGNVAFRCTRQQQPEIERRLPAAILQRCGFEPKVILLTVQELEHAVAANPFMDARRDPANLHVWFLREAPPNPDLEALARLRAMSERYGLERRVFYLHAPEGLASSKLARGVERYLGADGTRRDWETVTQTLEIAWDLP